VQDATGVFMSQWSPTNFTGGEFGLIHEQIHCSSNYIYSNNIAISYKCDWTTIYGLWGDMANT
jgi:hypothetical protein